MGLKATGSYVSRYDWECISLKLSAMHCSRFCDEPLLHSTLLHVQGPVIQRCRVQYREGDHGSRLQGHVQPELPVLALAVQDPNDPQVAAEANWQPLLCSAAALLPPDADGSKGTALCTTLNPLRSKSHFSTITLLGSLIAKTHVPLTDSGDLGSFLLVSELAVSNSSQSIHIAPEKAELYWKVAAQEFTAVLCSQRTSFELL